MQSHVDLVRVDRGLDIYADPKGQLELKDVLALAPDAWTVHQEGSPNFGFTQVAYWVRFRLKNFSSEKDKVLLSILYPLQNQITLFDFRSDELKRELHMGDHLPFADRPIESRNFVIPFELEQDEVRTIYLRMQGDTVQIPIELARHNGYIERLEKEILGWGIYYGIVTVMVLYNFFLFISFKNRSYILYVAYISNYALLQMAMTGFALQHLWPDNPWWGNVSICFFLGNVNTFLNLFVQSYLETKKNMPRTHRVIHGMTSLSVGLSLGSLILPYGPTVMFGNILVMFDAFLIIYVFSVGIYHRSRSSLFFGIAFTSFLLGVFLRGMKNLGFLPEGFIVDNAVTIGSAAEVILLSLALGDKINQREKQDRNKIQQLNVNLQKAFHEVENQVEMKTRHIASVMRHIEQGIFTILPDLTIEKYYSRFLIDIVGLETLEQRNVIETIFRPSNLNADQVQVLEGVLINSLGELAFNFEVNEDHLPREMTLNGKIIELNWQAIVESHGLVERVMVVARDVTSLKALQEQSEEQKHELKVIGKLLQVSTDRCHSFFTKSASFLQENKLLIETVEEFREESLRTIFMNYHTMKASAREFDLTKLLESLHEAESYCAKLRQDPSLWDGEKLRKDFALVESAYNEYAAINYEVLGRRKERSAIFSKKSIETALEMFQSIPDVVRDRYRSLFYEFRRAYFDEIEAVFQPIWTQVKKLAASLNKPMPDIETEFEAIWVDEETSMLIQSVFSHIVRNSMDHGIEDPDARVAKDKLPQGSLSLSVRRDGDGLEIRYQDDGKGLNLNDVLETAIDQGYATPDLDDPVKVANLIFIDGFSSSRHNITEISGRGVGMSAIKHMVEDKGGHCEIEFLEPPEFEANNRFGFHIRLPESHLALNMSELRS
ncbi:Histidine kinase-, DNA gyrase B-, and HSP90-like ATPase [Pseudobacteriovorax antillogorgiicola]|uniref:histidine kinase n=1 Tax=Pseudobacteriovorax antillogorgiicola TaxID=1513793 RepID=A0A1Y6BHS4_9BACT|nr:histidine kinase/DNA gyrase B/HSP90-like ATPase [Pseudobacteriovorax antillogorgiicola]SMF12420.1 Histidine kinase-, DNA gyrase B-, and HSP90-like ATPase [Pseudobacteriovorax antillogorgiicola]